MEVKLVVGTKYRVVFTQDLRDALGGVKKGDTLVVDVKGVIPKNTPVENAVSETPK